MVVNQKRLEYEKECNASILNQSSPDDGKLYCEPFWDTWGCWNYTLAGTTAFIDCPSHHDGFDPKLKAHRVCNAGGEWWVSPVTNKTWANYTMCINQVSFENDKNQVYLFIAGYSISILFLLVSLIIFCMFRQLQCDRITIHKNLFTSYILNGSVWIFYYTLVAMDVQVQHMNPMWCQVMHVVTQYFVQCNYFWMFCEGFYLHMIIVMAFMAGKKLLISCYVIGWGLPLLFTTVYTATRAVRPEETIRCWASESILQWIIAAPIVLSILINFLFLINILRVLLTKLRSVQTPDTNSYRKATKAILILIPLLGIQYMLFPIKFADEGVLFDFYIYAVAFVASFQGMFVSLIFCFFNGEVHTVIKRRWGQHRLMSRKMHQPRSTYFTSMTEQNTAPPTKSILKSKGSKERKHSMHRQESVPSNYYLDESKASERMLDQNSV